MNLQGRNISIQVEPGDDVVLLQSELRLLGYEIPVEETEEKRFGPKTEEAVFDFQKTHALQPTGVVDEVTAKRINEEVSKLDQRPTESETFIVKGEVRRADGKPIVGIKVQAFDKDLRTEQHLNDVLTDPKGRYEITYTAEQFRRAEKKSADLIVRAFPENGQPVASDTFFNAPPVTVIDIIVSDGKHSIPSEYERFMEELDQVREDVAVAEFTDDDIKFLTNETGIDIQYLLYLRSAHRLATKTKLLAEVFYGFARENLPTDLTALLIQKEDVLRLNLESALRDNIIPARLRDELNNILAQLKELAVDLVQQPAEAEGKFSLGALLDTAINDAGLQRSFLLAYTQHTGTIEDFWQKLKQDPNFQQPGLIEDLQFTLQLGTLTQNHLPLVQEMKRRKGDGEIQQLRDLASLDTDAWLQLIKGPTKSGGFPPDIPGKDDNEKAHNYATILMRIVEETFPTAVIAHRITRDEVPHKTGLSKFFANDPNFEFGKTYVDEYLLKNADKALAGIDDKDGVKQQLKVMDRVFKLTPRYSEMSVLLNDKLHSAQSIVRVGQDAFIQRYGERLGPARAKQIYAIAENHAAAALALFGEFGSAFNATPMRVLSQPLKAADAIGVSNWETLFGSLDFCECQHCRSVYGPAAYLVDILAFLKDRASQTAGRNAREILFDRRPDLGEIELTCENTNELLSYVDLVLEALESAVSPLTPFAAFTIPAALSRDLDAGNVSDELRAAFTPRLSNLATIAVKDKGDRWHIHEPAYTYTVENTDGQLRVTTRSRQTSGTAEERRANPQYVHRDAYDLLATRVYPFNLPFDLWAEEARTYLDHLGVQRHELMRTFSQRDLNDATIAAEHLGLTPKERQIVTGEASEQLWQFWGVSGDPGTDGRWIEELSRVDVFLDRSRLTYSELCDLLDTRFINPDQRNKAIDIDRIETCDTREMRFTSLTKTVLGRMVRFVKLWRKIGWPMRELDQALAALDAPEANDAVLVQLSHLKRLRAKLDLSPAQALSFWSLIDTFSYNPEINDSVYTHLFQNRSVTNPVNPDFTLRSVGAAWDLSPTTPRISAHISTILSAFNIKANDLNILTTARDNDSALVRSVLVTDDVLNLENLSKLYRVAVLSKALALPIEDCVTVIRLTQINPFDPTNTANTLLFVDKVRQIRRAGFSVAELNYLLRHDYSETSGVGPTDEHLASMLSGLRDGLQKIAAELANTSDPTGEQISRNLALLNWSGAWIQQALAHLDDTLIYETALASLPQGLLFPDAVKDRISYDAATHMLRFTGVMTTTDRTTLSGVTAAEGEDLTSFQSAVDQLSSLSRTAARTFISQRMRAFELPAFDVDLATMPAVVFPAELRDKIFYDAHAHKLRFTGAMTVAEREQLISLSRDDRAYTDAVRSLFDQPRTYHPESNNEFLIAGADPPDDPARTSFTELFDSEKTVAARHSFVLSRINAYLRRTQSENLVKQKISETLRLEPTTVDQLLTSWVNSAHESAQPALADFLAANFIDSRSELTAGHFQPQFNTLIRLTKVAAIVSKFKLTHGQLVWITPNSAAAGWLTWNSLPVHASDAPAQLSAWERLLHLTQLRDNVAGGETTLAQLFALAGNASATKAVYLQALSERTGWNLADLETLAGRRDNPGDRGLLDLNFPTSFHDERALIRLHECFPTLNRLGTSAAKVREWIRPDVFADDAEQIKQTVKAKYDHDQWLIVAKPLRDVLREKQRSALVDYLMVHPEQLRPDLLGRSRFETTAELYEYFLLDVEMSPCQMTSRIKQAISSVQLFVQRCLMNLEINVKANAADRSWRQWHRWMKNYRIWEANRKIFLYPENWIEPELRDDKSPFFKELENDLLSNEITQDTAEQAFLNYLDKLDRVARLEVVGIYHQLETDDDGNVVVDIFHVFARTRGNPNIYYYRQWVDSDHWTPWEKVDVDIQGNHLIPVIWNRRLYLFWPVFTQKAIPPDEVDRRENREPAKYWEIQIAWSDYNRGWSAKRLSKEHLDARQFAVGKSFLATSEYSFSTFVGDDLTIRCSAGGFAMGDFHLTGCSGTINVQHDPINTLVMIAPRGTIWENMTFKELGPGRHDNRLYFFEGFSQPVPPINMRTSDIFATVWISAFIFDSVVRVRIDTPVLNATPGTFSLVAPDRHSQFIASQMPFFYQDDNRTFLVTYPRNSLSWSRLLSAGDSVSLMNVGALQSHSNSFILGATSGQTLTAGVLEAPVVHRSHSRKEAIAEKEESKTDIAFTLSLHLPQLERQYRFHTFYHPYVCRFTSELNRGGLDNLLQRSNQTEPRDEQFFKSEYDPDFLIVDPRYPIEEVDFSRSGAYALYNWELFFHAPLLIADRLSQNQRFEEAQRWFHYIFDPTDTSSHPIPQRYWRTRPFFETSREEYQRQRIQNLLHQLTSGDPELVKQVEQWRDNPFNPHLVARFRSTAYQKTVVMKYLDNLIAWGDQLFRRDTLESINEATQLYILAAEILGRRPQIVKTRKKAPVRTYSQLEPELDRFGNALVEAEGLVPSNGTAARSSPRGETGLPNFYTHYFCVPHNDKLLGYWDIVADRLFKIRHCMNIEGVVRQLPLFEPPIDPALLVRAAAAGIDLSSILNDVNAALPHYRFNVMAQKASELCNEVKGLGAALLSALEKRDAEALALLRSSQEIKVLKEVREVKERQIREAFEGLEGLRRSKEVIETRQTYYRQLIEVDLTPGEREQLAHLQAAVVLQSIVATSELLSTILWLIPQNKVGLPFTAGATFGGHNLASSLQSAHAGLSTTASALSTQGSMAVTKAGYDRRKEEWQLQLNLTTKELDQVQKQIDAGEIRVAIAEKELANHDLQMENAKQVDEVMRNKFTNQQLYDWMVGQLAGVYFQSYQLAYDVARRAERAYRHELGIQDSSFIEFGYWDSLKKGLLAGEKLSHDLKRLELAYLDQNRREYEITKHISLAQLNPLALIQLKQTGQCVVSLPEALFDLDYPGHFMRRIKSVGLTIPAVVGPYTSVNCTLTLLSSRVRPEGVVRGTRYDDDLNYRVNYGSVQSIATSHVQNDSGLFELNFRDERYLPFEALGAISDWRIEMPLETNAFDFESISDVILHLRYTARDGGDSLKRAAQAALPSTGIQLFSARHEFPTEWYRFIHPEGATGDQILRFSLRDRAPFWLRRRNARLTRLELFVKVKDEVGDRLHLSLPSPVGELTLVPWNGLLRATVDDNEPDQWELSAWLDSSHERLPSDAIEEIALVCHYLSDPIT